jgi:hypothetical protein
MLLGLLLQFIDHVLRSSISCLCGDQQGFTGLGMGDSDVFITFTLSPYASSMIVCTWAQEERPACRPPYGTAKLDMLVSKTTLSIIVGSPL